MNIYVDVDNTITETSGMDYQNAKPIYDKIEIINKLYDLGHTITY
jgi:predicted mannosyl-3-phosphoglycerate phosphatase (HAD superfamily)